MKELDMEYGITIRIEAKGPGLYIVGHSVEEVIDFLAKQGDVYDEMKWNAMDILYKAKKCNANLRELQSVHGKDKLSISFEFENWEDFLGFKKIMEKNSHS